MFHFIGDGVQFLATAGIAEKFVDIFDAKAGGDPFGTDMAVLLDEIFEQRDLKFVPRCKIRMSPLAGPDMVFVAIPVKSSLAQSGAGRDDAAVAFGSGGALLHNRKVARLKMRDAVGIRFEVIQNGNMGNSKFLGNLSGIDTPSEVGGLGASIAHDARNAKARRQHRRRVAYKKLTQHGVQAGIACARVSLLAENRQGVSCDAEQGKIGFRAADVASEDEVLPCGHHF